MPCYFPRQAWRSKVVNPATGKQSLVFNRCAGDPGTEMKVPCRNCVGCRLDNARQWQLRLMHEKPYHELSCFLTFTYANQFLPAHGNLDKEHFPLFMKRLRRNHEYNGYTNKLKYLMCGEYGGNTNRPHYHAIVFGLDFADKKYHSTSKRGDRLYVSEKLDQLWGMGHCYVGTLTAKSAGYVGRYCLKKVNGDRSFEYYSRVNVETGEVITLEKEYITASNGLGLSHFNDFHETMYLRDSCILEGKETAVPKYYDRKLEQINEQWLYDLKTKRIEQAKLRADENTEKRLLVRHEVKQAQVKLLKRELE